MQNKLQSLPVDHDDGGDEIISAVRSKLQFGGTTVKNQIVGKCKPNFHLDYFLKKWAKGKGPKEHVTSGHHLSQAAPSCTARALIKCHVIWYWWWLSSWSSYTSLLSFLRSDGPQLTELGIQTEASCRRRHRARERVTITSIHKTCEREREGSALELIFTDSAEN